MISAIGPPYITLIKDYELIVEPYQALRDMGHRYQIMQLPESFGGKTVLDVGCNTGLVCLEAKRRGATRVVGFDHKRTNIERAQRKAEEENLQIEYYLLNIDDGLEDLKSVVGPEKFDYTFVLSIWKHVDQRKLGAIIDHYTREICWLEDCNHKKHKVDAPEKAIKRMSKILHFKKISFLGSTTDRHTRNNFQLLY